MNKASILIFFGFSLFIVLPLSVVGMFTHGVLVHEPIMQALFYGVLAYSAVIQILCFVYGIWRDTAFKRGLITAGQKPSLTFFVTAIVVPLMAYSAFCNALPAIAHWLSASPGELRVSAYDKITVRSCSNGVLLQGYTYFLNDRLCGLNKEQWRALKFDDKILVSGQRSLVGFTYSDAQKITVID